MKVLFLMRHLYPPLGGAELSIDSLIKRLGQDSTFQVSYACANARPEPPEELLEQIWACDVVLTQLAWAPKVLEAAHRANKKSVYFFRSYEGLCLRAHDNIALSHCGQRCGKCPARARFPAQPDLAVANSKFSQTLLREEHGMESIVVYPFVEPRSVVSPPGDRRYITMNQCAYHKGADIFLQIARALPEHEFRIVGTKGWIPAGELPPNVRITGPLAPRDIYRDTRVFLAPARWNEPFGRVVLEARLNGVPVLASSRGAYRTDGLLPAENLVEDVEDVSLWKKKIEAILDNYQDACAASRSFDAARFSPEAGIAKLSRALLSLAN